MKYLSLAQTKRQHQYLGLPGEFKTRIPTEIVYPDMTLGRADELYYTNEHLLIDLEEESDYITEETLIKFAKYLIFEGYMYTDNLYLAVICQKDPKKEFEHYHVSPSLSIKVHYIYISQDELWVKYENIIIELPRPVRGRGFLLHGLVLSHESRITVLSPQFLRFTNVSSIKSINPSFLMFFAALMSLSWCVWQCGHVHSFLSPKSL